MDDFFAQPDEPEAPTGAHSLDDDPELQAEQRARKRRLIGIAVVVIGLGAAGLAIAAAAGKDDGNTTAAGGTTTTAVVAAPAGGDAAATGTGAGATSGGGKGTSTAKTGKRHWPTFTYGRPKAFGKLNDPPPADPGKLQEGWYLWQDFDGWHLWLVGHPGGAHASVTSDDKVLKADGAGDAKVSQTANRIDVIRNGSGEVLGVDFNPGYFAKTLIIAVDDGQQLHVGAGAGKRQQYLGVTLTTD